MPAIDLYFDFISPYAYLGFHRLQATDADVQVNLHPVLFAALLDHHGQLGPAEIPAKRDATALYTARYARLLGIPLVGPPSHPFNPLTALRLALPGVAGDDQARVVTALFNAIWGEGIDGGDPEALAAALDRAGLDGASLLARTRAPEVKEGLKRATEAAIARGIFGVPTFFVVGEGFFGNDALDHALLALEGRDPLSAEERSTILARPIGQARRR